MWDVCESSICLCVQLGETLFPVDWRILVQECVGTIGIPLDVFGPFSDFLLFLTQATMQDGGVSRAVAVAVDFSEMLQLKRDI